jgi:hypothetical protein
MEAGEMEQKQRNREKWREEVIIFYGRNVHS